MKKLLLTCTMLLALVGLNAPATEAAGPDIGQFCFKWVVFCDGIQVNSVSGGNISSEWYHFDCANNTPMTSGSKGEAPVSNVCPGGNGSGLISCTNCGGFGDWHFVIDAPLNGTLDMAIGNYPAGSCWIDELAYSLQMGACTGLKQGGERGQMQDRSSVE